VRLFSLLAVLAATFSATTPADAQQPGTLTESRPMDNAPTGMQAWRIRYAGTNDRGGVEEMTGVVIAPLGLPPRMGRPVLAWAHGTWGVADTCTPSASPNVFSATPALADMIARGYAVVAPDYAGLGTPHPYLVGTSAAYSVLDAVRAARVIAGAVAGSRFAVWGESQGGHAALWTGQLAKGYAPELTLVGVAAAAPPTDLVENLTGKIDPTVRAFMTAYAAHSWSQHFGLSLQTLGKKATGDLIDRLARNNCVTLDAKPRFGMVVGLAMLRQRLKNVDLGKISPWKDIARNNSPAARNYGVPFLIAQNTADALVAPDVTKAFVRKLCRDTAQVRYISITSTGGHATSAADSAETTLDWIGSRFAGDPASSDCGKI
jgi:acetyl esterase/lipase